MTHLRRTPAPNTGWRRSEPAVIQTPDTRGPWDQRKAEAAAAGLAVVAILEAAGDRPATLAIHCWTAESGTQARVYARVPADAARTLTDEHPLTRDESLLWPLWTGTVCGAPVTITTHPIALPSRRQAAHPVPLPVEPLRDGSHQT